MSVTPLFGKAGRSARIALPLAPGFMSLRATRIATFNASAIWVAPAGVRSVSMVRGMGAIAYFLNTYRTITRWRAFGDGGSQVSTAGPTLIQHDQYDYPVDPPGDYCDPEQPGDGFGGIDWDGMQTCYSYSSDVANSSAQAFSRSFPPSVITSFTNITVVPGASYTITVPSKGFVEITYG